MVVNEDHVTHVAATVFSGDARLLAATSRTNNDIWSISDKASATRF